MVEISRSADPLSTVDIEQVERQIGLTLPEDLKAFYLRHNGGRVTPNLFPKNGEMFEVHNFFPMRGPDPRFTLERSYQILVLETPEFPRGFIPFADDEGGDHFMYSVRSQDKGAIFFNQSEYFDDPDRYVVFLAPSLQAFLDGLVSG